MNAYPVQKPCGRVPIIIFSWIAFSFCAINVLRSLAQSALYGLISCTSLVPYILLVVYAMACYGRGEKGKKFIPVIWLCLALDLLMGIPLMFLNYYHYGFSPAAFVELGLYNMIRILPSVILMLGAAIGLFINTSKKVFHILGAAGGGLLVLLRLYQLVVNMLNYMWDMSMIEWLFQFMTITELVMLYTALLLIGLLGCKKIAAPAAPVPQPAPVQPAAPVAPVAPAPAPAAPVAQAVPAPIPTPTPAPAPAAQVPPAPAPTPVPAAPVVQAPAPTPAPTVAPQPASAPAEEVPVAGAVVNVEEYIAQNTPEQSLRFLRNLRDLGALSEEDYRKYRDEVIAKL